MTDVGAPENQHTASKPPIADALVWPPPVDDLDVLWLDEPPRAEAAASTARAESIPLSRLRSGVAVEWHDAVALLQQFLDQAAPDRTRLPAGSVPPLDAIGIDPSGRLVFTLAAPGEPFVKGLGRLLNELLQSNPAPANLRLLAWQAASDSAAPLELADFGRQLAGWERPNRAAALAALHGRAAGAKSDITTDALLVEPPPRPAPQPTAPAQVPPVAALRRKRALVYASAAAAAVLSGAGVALYVTRSQPPSIAATEAAVVSTETGSDIELRSTGGRHARRAEAAARASAAATSRRITAPPIGLTGLPPDGLPSESKQAGDVMRTSESVEEPPLELFGESAPVATSEPPIYTNDDRSVAEPRLIRPYLPFRAHSGTPPDALGMLELVVDAHGAVESVHLNSPDNRYRERWWVFAAKNWQFRPAMKNGVPVRFLKRIPLTDLNMLEPQ